MPVTSLKELENMQNPNSHWEYWFVSVTSESIGNIYHLPDWGWVIVFDGVLHLEDKILIHDNQGNDVTGDEKVQNLLRTVLQGMVQKMFKPISRHDSAT